MKTKTSDRTRPRARVAEIALLGLPASLALLLWPACARNGSGGPADAVAATTTTTSVASDGPANTGAPLPPRQDGTAARGRDVFRFETFGNEGFWTDAVRRFRRYPTVRWKNSRVVRAPSGRSGGKTPR